jgi:predicted TIM-barrel fold metal-dependent hydrolase
MICDSHCHLKHGDAEGTEYSPQAIVEMMDAVGIGKAVVFAMSTTTRRSIEMAEAAVKAFPDRLIPYVYALPSYQRPVCAELEEAISQRGFRGIKIHLGECTVASYVIDPVMELAGRCRVPCLVDFLGRYGAAESLATRFPHTNLIICHLGQYLCTNTQLVDRFIGLAERCRNVYLDISGVVMLHMIQQAVARVGSGRVIWGTDGPHQTPDTTNFARISLDSVRMLHLAAQAEADVLGGSILRLLGAQ